MGTEFDVIAAYFDLPSSREDVLLGVGDDGAVLRVPPGYVLVVSTDTLVAGVHFPQDTPAQAIGHKALAVNLSDLAAMGAQPAWVTLALTLPAADRAWISGFMQGFRGLLEHEGVALVGGDTTSGPLSITVQALGWVEPDKALRRDAARPDESIFVTGTLGDAAAGLHCWQQGIQTLHSPALIERLCYPTPRCALGTQLHACGVRAAIDISDGLCADLGHILKASALGATLYLEHLPLSAALQGHLQHHPVALEQHPALNGGDDYELLFTAPAPAEKDLRRLCTALQIPLTCIGHTHTPPGCLLQTPDGRHISLSRQGYEHFAPAC